MELTIKIDTNLINGIIQSLCAQLVTKTKTTDELIWIKQQPELYHQYSKLIELYMNALYGVLEELHALLVSRTGTENCLTWTTKEPDLAAKYLALHLALASVYVNTVNESNTPVNKNQDIDLSVFLLEEVSLMNQFKKI